MSNFDFKNIFRRETKLASYIIICLTIVVISLSYAMFFQVDENTVNQEVVAGNLTFTYSEGNVISSSMQRVCFEPMSDDEASLFMSSCGYEFSVTNTGTLKASYTLKLLANEENVASKEDLKIILRKRVGDTYEVVDGYPKRVSDLIDGVLLTSELNEKETLVYLAQIYVDESTYHDNYGEVISYRIEGSGMVHEDESIGIDTNNMMRERNVLFEDGNVIKDGFEDDSNIWDHLRSATKIIFKNKIDNLDDVHSVVDMSYSKNNSVVMYFDSSGEDLLQQMVI